jgi:uncharacterized phage protein (TIGR02216 family)
MELGFCRLRLCSKDFWAMTPRELVAALGGGRRGQVIDRAAFEALREAFPDGEGELEFAAPPPSVSSADISPARGEIGRRQ